MRFLISVIDDRSNSGSPEEMLAIDAFNDGLRAAGNWIFAAGLHAPEQSTVIDNRNESGISSEGPLIDSPEYMSGFWLIEAPDEQTARHLAFEGSKACNRKVELRKLHG